MYYLLTALGGFIGRLSPDALGRIARWLAFLSFDVLRLRRRVILENLERAFGHEKSHPERLSIGRTSVYHFALTILEFFRGVRTDIAANVSFKRLDIVHQALDEGRGVYVLAVHMGNFEVHAARMSRSVAPTPTIVKKVGSSGVDRFVSEQREKNGMLVIKRDRPGDAYRAIKKALSRGEMIGFMVDQARPGEPRLPFFGAPAKTNTSLASIWRLNPAPVVPSYILRTAPCHHEIHFLSEMEFSSTADRDRDVMENSTLMNRIAEECIRACPEQYFWMHKRWK